MLAFILRRRCSAALSCKIVNTQSCEARAASGTMVLTRAEDDGDQRPSGLWEERSAIVGGGLRYETDPRLDREAQ